MTEHQVRFAKKKACRDLRAFLVQYQALEICFRKASGSEDAPEGEEGQDACS